MRWGGLVPPDSEAVSDAARQYGIDPVQLEARFKAAFYAPDYQPPVLPAVALELMALARQPDVTFPKVAALLESDPVLAGQLLRLVQSPVYRRSQAVRSLEHAVSVLGLRAVSDLFLQVSLSARVFRAPAYEGPMTEVREHSAALAILSRLICCETTFSDDYAFLCGLLHDIGTAVSIILLADDFGGGRGKRDPVPLSAFWPVIRATHEATGARLAELW